MGVKSLHWFVTKACPDGCLDVNLKEIAQNHSATYPGSVPVLVVDAMSCLRKLYTPPSWVCGGQWREYYSSLENFVNRFTAAGIKLVFYFDGLVEQKKRDEWVKRRLNNSKEIAKVFYYIKSNHQQPGKGMFVIPSGLATLTRYVLKSLGQVTLCSLQEADYEVASYGKQNNCMGILGEDTDYIIFDTGPYFSINRLQLDSLDTIMYSRQNLCSWLGLSIEDLPLFACLLGTDIVSVTAMEGFRNRYLSTFQAKRQTRSKGSSIIHAVASYISSIPRSYDSLCVLEKMLPFGSDESILRQGIEFYVLPGQRSPWLPCDFIYRSSAKLEKDSPFCLDQEIFQIAKEQHVVAENARMIYSILSRAESEDSNTLEDAEDMSIPGQAMIYLPVRQHIYSILLESARDSSGAYPVVKEWFVYAGNSLSEPDLVQPNQLPGGNPSLRLLWLGKGPEADKQRHWAFLACLQLQDMGEELHALETPIFTLCSLLLYLALQVDSLSLEDLHAYVAQALCLQEKSAAQLADLQLAQIDPRAVHLGSLFIRGLCVLAKVNSACGHPFRMDSLMPWHVFDGKLFQEKYQQAHSGRPLYELLEYSEFRYVQFQNLMARIRKGCSAKGKKIQSRQRLNTFMTGMPERGRGCYFDIPCRMQPPSYWHWDEMGQGRRPQQPGCSYDCQPPGPRYRPRHPFPRGQFQPGPRWPR